MDERLIKAQIFIQRHLTDRIRMDELAGAACTSYRNLVRLFKQYLNITPYRYIEQIKIQRSLQLIIDVKKSVQEISAELGYKNYETFSKAFLKVYHISPGDLKEILKSVNLSSKDGKSCTPKLEIQSTGLRNLPDYLNRLNTGISGGHCDQGCRAFLVSRKPLSIVSNTTKVRNKYYVAGI